MRLLRLIFKGWFWSGIVSRIRWFSSESGLNTGRHESLVGWAGVGVRVTDRSLTSFRSCPSVSVSWESEIASVLKSWTASFWKRALTKPEDYYLLQGTSAGSLPAPCWTRSNASYQLLSFAQGRNQHLPGHGISSIVFHAHLPGYRHKMRNEF